jgi:hypothetical protein
MSTQPNDPFAGGDTVPSISFKDAAIGTTFTGVVTEAPSLIQARDYETGQPAFWQDGGIKYTVVTKLKLSTGEERSLWAPKPSSMFAAISEAQKKTGTLVVVGGTLTVTFSGEKPNATNPRLNPQKLYTVSYTPPNAFETPALAAVPNPGTGNPLGAPLTYNQTPAPQWTPEQIAAAKAAGIPLPGVS